MDNERIALPGTGADPNGHRRRLREKFLKGGLSGFLDAEIIELLLTLGTPRRDCKAQAREALKEFKTFHGVLEASPRDLQRVGGIGPHNVFGLKLVQEVSRRFLRERMMSRPVCHSSREVFDYLYHALRELRKEQFKVIFLDTKNQVIEEKTLFEGTVDSSAVYPPSATRPRPSSSSTTTPRAIPSRPSATGRSPGTWSSRRASCRSRSWTTS
jgi:DNA repair protein RadC